MLIKIAKNERVTYLMPKVGRNEPCPCDGGKKYKNCCETKDIEALKKGSGFDVRAGEPIESERMLRLNQYLLDRYQMRVVNVTNMLSTFTVNRINSENSKRDVVVAAERCECNDGVFQRKGEDVSDVILIYKNNYLCFNYENEWDDMIKKLDNLIRSSKKR